jgi:hypothetical protein
MRLGELEIDTAAQARALEGQGGCALRSRVRAARGPCDRPGAYLSRAQLEERLYGWDEEIASNAVEVHIHGLRRKLDAELIRNVRGLGYTLAAGASSMRSLRRSLLVWSLAIVLLGGVIAAGVVFCQARSRRTSSSTTSCASSRFTLRDRDFSPEPARRGALRRGPRLRDPGVGAGLAPALPLAPADLDPGPSEPGFADVETALGTWRVFTIWHRGLWIQVAQHRLAREALALPSRSARCCPSCWRCRSWASRSGAWSGARCASCNRPRRR